MKDFIWRTRNTSTSYVYVDASYGSDQFGDGTMQNPFKTIGKAYDCRLPNYPSYIIVRGTTTEEFVKGKHTNLMVQGDYLGAWVHDGNNEGILYGISTGNVIYLNGRGGKESDQSSVAVGSFAYAGIGRTGSYINVGYAHFVNGPAASSAFMIGSVHYLGCIGGQGGTTAAAVRKCVFAKPNYANGYRIWFGGYNVSQGKNYYNMQYCTVYDVPISKRGYSRQNDARVDAQAYYRTLFAKTAIIANDAKYQRYIECAFSGDTKFYLAPTNSAAGADMSNATEITESQIEETMSAKGLADKGAAILEIVKAYDSNQEHYPEFVDCVFTDKLSTEIMNDPEQMDYTLNALIEGGNPCVFTDTEGVEQTIGAMPKSISIKILENSNGHTNCFDSETCTGCLKISTENNICLAITDEQPDNKNGYILTKVLKINPKEFQISEIYGFITNRFVSHKAIANERVSWGTYKYYPSASDSETATTAAEGDEVIITNNAEVQPIPLGKYLLCGGQAIYGGAELEEGSIINVTEEGTTLSGYTSDVYLQSIENPNVTDVIYCRCRAAIYATMKKGETYTKGATYINDSDHNITFRNRTVVPGESFVCGFDGVVCQAEDGEVGVLFDDPVKVPTAADWVPAQTMGEYFVSKSSGVIDTDTDYDAQGKGVPLSSGNPNSYAANQKLYKQIINQVYVQFKVEVNRM